MLDWGLRRLGVDKETAEEMKRMANVEERFYSQLDVRVREWTQQLLEQGRAEAVAAQREGLRRQAAVRFGASARLLYPHVERVESSAQLAEISVWLMVDTMDQVIAKIEAAAAAERID